ncbi:hypothetical protein ElyMa_001899400, partial [Elysia marginata]
PVSITFYLSLLRFSTAYSLNERAALPDMTRTNGYQPRRRQPPQVSHHTVTALAFDVSDNRCVQQPRWPIPGAKTRPAAKQSR